MTIDYDAQISDLEQEIYELQQKKKKDKQQRIDTNPKAPHVIVIYDTEKEAKGVVDYICDKLELHCFYVAVFDKLHEDIALDIIGAINEEELDGFEFSDE